MKYAIDVSLYDSRRYVWGKGWVYDQPIDWIKARYDGGLSLAIIKSSEGTWPDPAFKLNWTAAKGILPRMAYHFFRSNRDPIAQADYVHFLLTTSGFDHSKDFIILDLETMDGMSGAGVLNAAKLFQARLVKLGYDPLLYTYPSFWRAIGGETAIWAKESRLGLAQWPLDNYIARFPVNLFNVQGLADLKYKIEVGTLRPMALKPWVGPPALWQFTSRVDARVIPGHPAIKKAVDYNAIYMPLDEQVGPVPPPPPPPEPLKTYRCTALILKVFVGAGDFYKQLPPLVKGQEVKVLGYATSNGEMFAHIEQPAGWCRAIWLEKA